jgi:hypothetical protein
MKEFCPVGIIPGFDHPSEVIGTANENNIGTMFMFLAAENIKQSGNFYGNTGLFTRHSRAPASGMVSPASINPAGKDQ